MHARPRPRPSLYEQLEALPEGLTGETLDGQLYTQPRPAWLVDPFAHKLEADALEGRAWREIGRFAGAALVSVQPFEAVSFNFGDLWASTA